MKSILTRVASLLACLLIASCSKHDNTETAENEATPATPAPAATPEPVKAVVAATPAPKRLAPDGIFFLTVKKSVETPDGIFGLTPGTRVERQADGKYVADGHPIEVQASEMTNDLDIAARYAGADARAQAAIKQTLQAHPAPAKPGAPGTTASTGSPASKPAAPAPSSSAQSGLASGTQRSGGTMLDGSSAIGSAHTKTQGGWVYEKDASGNWIQVRPVR